MVELHVGNDVDLDDLIDVYVDSTLGARRPVHDRERMAAMLANANLVAAPAAVDYYPRIGFTHYDSAWTLDADRRLDA